MSKVVKMRNKNQYWRKV